MNSLEELSVGNRASTTSLRSFRGSRAAIRDHERVSIGAARVWVAPLVVHQLLTGCIATSYLVSMRVERSQIHSDPLRTLQLLLMWAQVGGEAGAIDCQPVVRARVSHTLTLDLQLEGQCPAVHEAHVDIVAALHSYTILARQCRGTECAFELRVYWRCTIGVVIFLNLWWPPHAGFLRPSRTTQSTIVSLLVAAHLGPIAGRRQFAQNDEIVGRRRIQLNVLRVRTCCRTGLVSNPNGLGGTPIDNSQTTLLRICSSVANKGNSSKGNYTRRHGSKDRQCPLQHSLGKTNG
mmetsp:Transcript_29311/g.63571  ORF Transcript_29311/g.63571 Transcript_29311/m.63571 type:complete len:292 (-) Transcript_29311:12-887(-)